MATQSPQARAWPPPLAGRLTGDASAEQIADAVGAVWQDIERALHPIIGHRGVAALYQRSLSLTTAAHPWLAVAMCSPSATVDMPSLHAALLQQPAAEAGRAGSALFAALHGLLGSLVGASLTDRLLRAAWAPTTDAPPPQDTTP